MNINRHNYEEFFLLYVDNELTAGQRKIVDAFVASNPDLRPEFELIQQSTFTTDAKLDEGFIQSLLKPVADESSISEEQLLLYVDDELNAAGKEAVEKELLNNISLQKELQWLRRSKATADTSIVFPDKSFLYKQAAPARVFHISTAAKRWAAAAAVILLLGSAMWLMLDKPADPVAPVALTPTVTAPKQQTAPAATQPNEVKTEQVTTIQSALANNTAGKKEAAIQQQINLAKTDTEKQQQQINIPTVESNTIAKVETPVTVHPENNSVTASNKTETPTVQPITGTANTISYASYNNDSNSEDEQILFNEERQRRSGLTGFVKKAKRMFERKTGIQSSSSEVRFAVFAVNTQ